MTVTVQNFEIAELARRLENLIRIGTVAEVDPDQARVRVKYGEDLDGAAVLTGWLPWLTPRAGEDRDWWPPSDGEQVLLFSPSGELTAGIALPAIYQRAHPAPESDLGKHTALYRDGARIEYDTAAHHLKAVLPTGGTAELVADGGLTITGAVTITGDVAVTGRIDATEDIESAKNVEDKNGTMQEMRDTYNQHSHPPAGVTPQMD